MKNYLLLLLTILSFTGYSQSVTTDAATNVTATTATLNGVFTNTGGAVLIGTFEYDQDGSAPFDNSINSTPLFTTTNGTSTSAIITGLTANTTYYFWFTASNGSIDYYGSVLSFTTLPASVPTVQTGDDFKNITAAAAENENNEVISDNGAPITERGIAYSSSNNPPTISDNIKTSSGGVGVYDLAILTLQEATTYYARAYAKNSVGTSYGSTVRTFTTLPNTRAAITSMVSNATNELTINFTASSGSQTVIFMREINQITDYPVDGTTYTGNTFFGSGSNLGNNTYVVYAGSGSKGSVTVTNIDGSKDYHVDIADAAESGSDIVYFYDIDQLDTDKDSNLPVDLLFFNADTDNNSIILNWATASELNNHYFKVEKSYDLTNFTEVKEVLGQGNSLQQNNYSVVDNDENNLVYYRLSQYDYDGTETVFDVIAVQKTQNEEISIEKLLVADNLLNVSIKASELQSKLEIFNLNGKLVHSEVINQEGISNLKINMSELSKGIYLMRLSNNNEASVIKFYY